MKKIQVYSAQLTSTQKETLVKIFPSIFGESSEIDNNFKLTIEKNNAPNILYHYTSMNILQSILERIHNEKKSNENCFVLRGTHIEFLNDVTEFKLTIKLLTEALQKYENSLPKSKNKHIASKLNPDYWKNFSTLSGNTTLPFITSFSENPDSLPMWRMYGHDGIGVAIGIERVNFTNSAYASKFENYTWVKCAYDLKLLEDILSKAAKDIYEMFDINGSRLVFKGFPNTTILSIWFSLLKNSAFEYEQEWRLVKKYSKNEIEKKMKFQEKEGLLKPFVEHFLPKKILKEVIIGPCAEKEISKKSLELSLERAGYSINSDDSSKENFVKINISQIPFRRI
jgi:hypothetical protein